MGEIVLYIDHTVYCIINIKIRRTRVSAQWFAVFDAADMKRFGDATAVTASGNQMYLYNIQNIIILYAKNIIIFVCVCITFCGFLQPKRALVQYIYKNLIQYYYIIVLLHLHDE